jgi:ribonuclease P protein component
MPARFRPRQRLRTRAEFDRVFRRGVRLDGRLFALVALASAAPHDRLGLAVGRPVGDAVRRNRARRLLRESFRRLEPAGRARLDLVLIGKRALAAAGQAEVDRELQDGLRRLLRREPRFLDARARPPR